MVEIERLPPERAGASFADELADLWYRVSRAGGAVGFTSDVERADVVAAADHVVAALAAGRSWMVAAREAGRLVGTVRLERGAGPIVRHRAMLKLLMVDPDRQARGIGRRLVDAALEVAAEAGIEQVYLSARGGTGLPDYYARRGFHEVGRFPGGVRLAPGDDRDEVWLLRRIA